MCALHSTLIVLSVAGAAAQALRGTQANVSTSLLGAQNNDCWENKGHNPNNRDATCSDDVQYKEHHNGMSWDQAQCEIKRLWPQDCGCLQCDQSTTTGPPEPGPTDCWENKGHNPANRDATCNDDVQFKVQHDHRSWQWAVCEIKKVYPQDCGCLPCDQSTTLGEIEPMSNGTVLTSNGTVVKESETNTSLLGAASSGDTSCYDNTGHNPHNRASSCIQDVRWKMTHDHMSWDQAQCEIKKWYGWNCYCLDCGSPAPAPAPAPGPGDGCWENKGHNPHNRGATCIQDVQWKMHHDGMTWVQANCEIKRVYPSDCGCLECLLGTQANVSEIEPMSNGTVLPSTGTVVKENETNTSLLGAASSGESGSPDEDGTGSDTSCYGNTGHNPHNRSSSCIQDVQWKMTHDHMSWNQAQCEIKKWYGQNCPCLDCGSGPGAWCWLNKGHNPHNPDATCIDDVHYKQDHDHMSWHQANCEIKRVYPTDCGCLVC